MSALFAASSPYVWDYKTEPLTNMGKAFDKRIMRIVHGKSLGGSSSLNFMQYVRGNSKDFDEWHELGNPGWSFEEVLPYFKMSERFHNASSNEKQGVKIDLDYHGEDGRLWVMPIEGISKMSEIHLSAFAENGYKFGDYNGEMQNDETAFRAQVTQHFGLRADSYTSYVLSDVMNRKGILKVITFATVTKLLFKDDKKVVVNGIELKRFGTKLQFMAKKEVILSAGAIGSPKILMLSGLGPKGHLDDMKIPVIKDIPGIGENLQDHLMAYYMHFSPNTGQGLSPNSFKLTNPFEVLKYYYTRSGPLGDNGIGVGLFYNTFTNEDRFKRPDIQLHTFPALPTNDYGLVLKEIFGYTEEAYRTVSMFEGYDGGVLMPTLLRPESRGYVRLKSNNPEDNPIIQPNYFDNPKDMKKMIEALRIANKHVTSNAFKDNNIELVIDKNCEQFVIVGEPLNDEYYKCVIQFWSSSVWHFVGTCKMGPSSDPMSVVDHMLKVHGVMGLRVADASIMPRITGGNTNAPTIMIGEKAADLINSEWKMFDENVKNEPSTVLKDEL